MKKSMISLVLVLSLFSCKPKRKITCADFREGKFRLSSDFNGSVSIIERHDSTQTEMRLPDSSIVEARVKWISPCVYELRFLGQKIRGADSIVPILQRNALRIRIVKATAGYCIFEGSMQNLLLRDTLFRIRD